MDSTETYRDPTATIDDRVDDLLARMTLDEKLAQITSVWVTDLFDEHGFDPARAATLLEHGIGHVTRIGAATGLRPTDSAALMNQIQRFVVESTRLGIPVMVHEEGVAGYCARDATVFPQAIGLAATWDEALVEAVAGVVRRQMMAVGARHTLSPVLDVARDPRWGRLEETYGEDPYLAGRLGTAYVRGVQTDDLRRGVIATGKHFLGYALSEGGMNWAPVHLGPRELREVYAEPFAAAIRDAGMASVMNSYSSIDGLPCAGSRAILDDLLRGELGFDGVVAADYFAVAQLVDHHRVEPDRAQAGARALRAGLDLELPGRDCFGDGLRSLVEDGHVDIAVVDRAVRRVLRSKFQVGLFDRPYVDESIAVTAFDTETDRALARRAAAESMVLLTNDGVLPLDCRSLRRVAVIGPAADDRRLLQGDYHYPAHVEMLIEPTSDDLALAPKADDPHGSIRPGPHFVHHVTPLEGLRAALADSRTEVSFARGCDIVGDDVSGFDEAIRAAADAGVAVVVVGGRSGLTADCTVGEGRDAVDLDLPGVQQELVEAVAATGVPTIAVVVSGRAHTLARVVDAAAAVLLAWVPGEEGGAALADVLLGAAEPGGRLPVTLPRCVGQVPVHHGYRAGGGKAMFGGDYADSSSSPLFRFGHGLGYATFEYGRPTVMATGSTTETIIVEIAVTNTSGRPGSDVVTLTARDRVASVARPQHLLVGFTRVMLDPGATATVSFEVHPSRLAFFDEAMQFVTEPGAFTFSVGPSAGPSDKVTVELGGAPAAYQQRDIVATAVTVRSADDGQAPGASR